MGCPFKILVVGGSGVLAVMLKIYLYNIFISHKKRNFKKFKIHSIQFKHISSIISLTSFTPRDAYSFIPSLMSLIYFTSKTGKYKLVLGRK